MSVIVNHTYECSECGDKVSDAFSHYMSTEVRQPSPPPHWVYVDNILLCPKHEVRVITITPLEIKCPDCTYHHIDKEDASPHFTHVCQNCGMVIIPILGKFTRGVPHKNADQ